MKYIKFFLFFVVILVFCSYFISSEELDHNSVSESILVQVVEEYANELDDNFKKLKSIGPKSANFILSELKNKETIDISEFDKKYTLVEGAYRTNLEYYREKYGSDDVTGSFISSKTEITDDLKRLALASEPSFKAYALAVKENFLNMYLLTEENFQRIYEKDWALQIEHDHVFDDDLFYSVATPENNPEREPKWTPVYYDDILVYWMTSLITPLYEGDEFLGIVGHDVILNDVYDSIEKKTYGGRGYSFIFDSDKNIVIHPNYLEKLEEKAKLNDRLSFRELEEEGLTEAILKISIESTSGEVTFNEKGFEQVFIYKKLEAIDWYYGFVVQKSLIESEISQAKPMMNTTFFSILILVVIIVGLIFAIQFKILSLERNVIFVIVAITFLIVSAIFAFNVNLIGEKLKEQKNDEFLGESLEIAEDKSKEILKRFDVLLDDAQITSKNPDILSENREKNHFVIHQMFLRLKSFIDSLYLIDKDGNLIYADPNNISENIKDFDFKNIPDIQVVKEKKNHTIIEHDSIGSEGRSILLLMPVLKKGGYEGMIIIEIFLNDILKEFIEPVNILGKGHAHLLVNDMLYQADGFNIKADSDLISDINEGKSGVHEKKLITHFHEGDIRDILNGYGYGPVMTETKFIGVIVGASEEEILKEINEIISSIRWFTFAIIIVIIILGVIFSTLITRTLSSEVKKKTNELNELNKELDRKVEERTYELRSLSDNLEKQVKDRTKQLNDKVDELERFNRLAVGRELRMVELKKKVRELDKRIKF